MVGTLTLCPPYGRGALENRIGKAARGSFAPKLAERRRNHFIAEKRLSKELDCTIGAAPATTLSLGRSGGRGGSGGRGIGDRRLQRRTRAACSRPALVSAGLKAFGSGLASALDLPAAGAGGGRGGRGVGGGAADADLAGEAGEEAFGLRLLRAACAGGARRRGCFAAAGPPARELRRPPARRRLCHGARGGLTVPGMVPGARDMLSSDRPWPSPPSERPVCRRAHARRRSGSCRRRCRC